MSVRCVGSIVAGALLVDPAGILWFDRVFKDQLAPFMPPEKFSNQSPKSFVATGVGQLIQCLAIHHIMKEIDTKDWQTALGSAMFVTTMSIGGALIHAGWQEKPPKLLMMEKLFELSMNCLSALIIINLDDGFALSY